MFVNLTFSRTSPERCKARTNCTGVSSVVNMVRSASSSAPHDLFPPEFVYPSPALVSLLARAGIVLYGSDAPSMDHADSEELPGHNALLVAGIAILEGLDLSATPDGAYELVALPLKIAGGDGSPVRAVLRVV